MALLVSDVDARMSDLLFDPARARWSLDERCRWISDALKFLSTVRPEALTVTESVLLVAGVKQSLSANSVRLVSVLRNMGVNGTTPGRSIYVAEEETIRAYDPVWGVAAGSGVIENFCYDERTPLVFLVYPAVPASPAVYVELARVALPAAVTALTDALGIPDHYFPAVLDFALWRCFSKDAEFGPQSPQARAYQEQVAGFLGVSAQALLLSSPNTANEGGVPARASRGGGS